VAITVLSNCKIVVNSVDLSDHARQVTIAHGAKSETATKMGDDTDNFLPGLKVSGVEVDFYQDEASGKVNQTLFPLVGPGVAAFPVAINPVNATTSPTNPCYSFQAMLESAPPLTVAVGGISPVKAVFKPAGGTAATLLRATS
jgi:hypothetical protein